MKSYAHRMVNLLREYETRNYVTKQQILNLVMLHVTIPGIWWEIMYKIKRLPGQNFFYCLKLVMFKLTKRCMDFDIR